MMEQSSRMRAHSTRKLDARETLAFVALEILTARGSHLWCTTTLTSLHEKSFTYDEWMRRTHSSGINLSYQIMKNQQISLCKERNRVKGKDEY